jgi:hypothetical protein
MKKIKEMILVCERFGGLFSLLWHNSKFELENGDSLKEFYTEILEFVSKKNFASILPGLFIKKDYLNV